MSEKDIQVLENKIKLIKRKERQAKRKTKETGRRYYYKILPDIIREENKKTQKELAELIGIKYVTFNKRLINGTSFTPDEEEKIKDYLNYNKDDLFDKLMK